MRVSIEFRTKPQPYITRATIITIKTVPTRTIMTIMVTIQIIATQMTATRIVAITSD